MANNILESYFVRVVAMPDGNSFLRLSRSLLQVQNEITGVVGTAVGTMIKYEAAVVSTFAAVGLGLVAMADKAAMTDQSYRLLGLRMLMTKDSFQAFQQALDDVGVTADQAAYDPESNRRVQEQYSRNMRMQQQLGPDFEKNMEKIRDIRIQFKDLGRDAEYLEYAVINKMFTKLGFGSDDMSQKLERLNNWFERNLPNMADKVSDFLIPVWNDAKIVLSDFGDVLQTVGGDFSYLVGILSGDDSIKDTQFSIENLGKAAHDVFDGMTESVLAIDVAFKTLLHLVTGTTLAFDSAWQGLHGNTDKANELSLKAYDQIKAGVGNLTADESQYKDLPDFQAYERYKNSKNNVPESDLKGLLKKYSAEYGIDPELAAAVMYQESGNNPRIVSKTGAEGLMQLMPGAAKDYGVNDRFDPDQNLRGGILYLSDLLKKYKGDTDLALAAYNAGPGAVDKFGGIPPYQETRNYVQRVEKEYGSLKQKSASAGGDVVIHSISITVPPGTPQEKIREIISDSMNDTIRKNTANQMAQTAGGAYY